MRRATTKTDLYGDAQVYVFHFFDKKFESITLGLSRPPKESQEIQCGKRQCRRQGED